MKVAQSCPTLCDPMDYTVHGILQARILEWVAFPFSRESSQLRSPTLRADSLPAEPQGKPKNTGLGSLFLLQRIFLTQELNRGLLHCRRILYQLSPKGSPRILAKNAKTVKMYILANVVLTRLFWPGCTTCYINSVCFSIEPLQPAV